MVFYLTSTTNSCYVITTSCAQNLWKGCNVDLEYNVDIDSFLLSFGLHNAPLAKKKKLTNNYDVFKLFSNIKLKTRLLSTCPLQASLSQACQVVA